MAWYRCRHKSSGGGITPVGDAVVGDVLVGKTFTNATDIGLVGTMPNNGAVSQVLDTTTQSYTVPQGYHDGTGTVSISAQTKSATPSTSAQTITPDSGKVLSSVSVSAISPVRTSSTLNQATASGVDSNAPYVYFPYGWWPKVHNTYGAYVYMTAAQAQATHKHTATYTPTSRSAALDMGEKHAYRYVNTNSVPNTNSGTYTYASGSTGATADLGATNTYRYVNATNVYAKGKADAQITAAGSITDGGVNAAISVTKGQLYECLAVMSTEEHPASSITLTMTGGTVIGACIRTADIKNATYLWLTRATSTSMKVASSSFGTPLWWGARRIY